MIDLALAAFIAVASVAIGVAVRHFWPARWQKQDARKRERLNSSLQDDGLIVAKTASLELHLVCNVLNRIVASAGIDESASEAVEDLADYLRASQELSRTGPDALARNVTSYWRMSRWLHGDCRDRLEFNPVSNKLTPATAMKAAAAVIQSIRSLELTPRAHVIVHVSPLERHDGPVSVSVEITVSGVDEACMQYLCSSQCSWSRSGAQLCLQIDV
jgi:hypothetical protein